MTNTIATYAAKNFHSKKARDCYVLHTVLLEIILLLLTMATICYHYANYAK